MTSATRQMMAVPFLVLIIQAQKPRRYSELKGIVNANVGFAHATRGVNMYTLVALRSCVSTKDVGVLGQMLTDSDSIVRMASTSVLVDLGAVGKQAVQQQLDKTNKASERSILTEALNEAASSTYRPILKYPLTKAERDRIHGCLTKSQ